MSKSDLFEVDGQEINYADLDIQNAIEVAEFLSEGYPFFELISCKRDEDGNEYIIVNIEPSVTQKPKIDIKQNERLVVKFLVDQDGKPQTYALRKDFPNAPHINFTPKDSPKHLCISEIPFEEEKIYWTGARYLKLIQRWLSRTSKNNLHLENQPLEGVFYGTRDRIVLPSIYFDPEKQVNDGIVDFIPLKEIDKHGVIVGLDEKKAKEFYGDLKSPFKSITIDIEKPLVHGIIEFQPVNLLELHEYLKRLDINLLRLLKSKFYLSEPEELKGKKLLLIFRVPKKRSEEGPVENIEVLCFSIFVDLLELSKGLGTIYEGAKRYKTGVNHVVRENAKKTKLYILNPASVLTTKDAAKFNRLNSRCSAQITAVGVGALGSQIILNTVRAGQGKWHLVDEDHLLPHNIARHALSTRYVGAPKADAMKHLLDEIFLEETITSSNQNIDVIKDPDDEFGKYLNDSEYIFDFSASVAVARKLTLDFETDAPRVSCFLNPNGQDLVLLAESNDRSFKLDILEMEYYKFLYTNSRLDDHLIPDGNPIRYAHNCRDLSARIPQYLFSIHSGIASKQIVDILSEHDSHSINVWHVGENAGVQRVDIPASQYQEESNGNYTIVVSEKVLNQMDEDRTGKLPNETGGVLIGTIDRQRDIIYVVDCIGSPSDSDEWPTAYIRGVEGLKEKINSINKKTGGNLGYLGEWHSHPEGASLEPSEEYDKKLFEWLQEYRSRDSSPAIMTIVGNYKSSWYVAQTENSIDFEI